MTTRAALLPRVPAAGLTNWILRIGVVMEYVGHGTLGLYQKPIFAKYLALFGLGAYADILRPLIGAHDCAIALIVLLVPNRAVLVWAALWGVWTSFLRPLAGEPWWEFVERSYNFGGPLALLLLAGPLNQLRDPSSWFGRVREWALPVHTGTRLVWTLRLVCGSMLIGHGGYCGFMHKDLLMQQWAALGVQQAPFGMGPILDVQGFSEIALGAMVLLRPSPRLLVLAALWKLWTEAMYPLSGLPAFHPIFEFVERGGSYACPLALAFLMARSPARRTLPTTKPVGRVPEFQLH